MTASKYWCLYFWISAALAYGQGELPPQAGTQSDSLAPLGAGEAADPTADPVSTDAPQNSGVVGEDAAPSETSESVPETAIKANSEELDPTVEQARWSASSSLAFSRLVDSVNSSEYLNYSTGLTRRADDKSTWGFALTFGQDGKFRDDPALDGMSWSRGFPYSDDDPHEISYRYSGALLDPQKIGKQGYRLQNSLGAKQNIYADGGLVLFARASTFILLTEFEQTIAGQEYTWFGLGEGLVLNYSYSDVSLTISFGFDQGYRGKSFRFSNANSESLDYAINKHWGIGLSHGVSTLVLDPVARGTQPNILLGDAESSQISFSVSYLSR